MPKTQNKNEESLKHLGILQELEVSEDREKVRVGDYLAGVESDPDRSSLLWGFKDEKILPIEDELLLELEGSSPQSIHVYKKLMSDQSVSSPFCKIEQEICSRDVEVTPFKKDPDSQPNSEDKYIALKLEKQIESLKYDTLTKDLLEAIITGISTAELKWEPSEIGANIVNHKYVEPRRIQFDINWNPYLLTKDNSTIGLPLAKYSRNFIFHRYYQSPHDSPYGYGLGRVLYHPVLFLRRAIESWSLAADRYATPLAIASLTDDASKAERVAIMRLLSNLSREKVIVLPKEWDINFVQPQARADFYENQIAMFSQMINKLIAGETTTGEAGDIGSYGRDAISKSILMNRAAYFSKLLDETINDQMVRAWVDVNFGKGVPAPKVKRKMINAADELPLQDATSLMGYGIPMSAQWLAETYKFKLDEKVWKKGGEVAGVNIPPHEEEIQVTNNVFQDLGWD